MQLRRSQDQIRMLRVEAEIPANAELRHLKDLLTQGAHVNEAAGVQIEDLTEKNQDLTEQNSALLLLIGRLRVRHASMLRRLFRYERLRRARAPVARARDDDDDMEGDDDLSGSEQDDDLFNMQQHM